MSTRTQRQAYPDTHYRNGEPLWQPWIGRATLIVVSTLILTNLVAALLVAGYQVYYDGVIFPGVGVWGVDLSGMTPAQAAAELQGHFTYPQTATITFRDGENVWPLTAGELGVHFDVERTVQAAYDVGRRPNLFTSLREQATAWREGVAISPVVVFDQMVADRTLQQIATQINRPAVDATIRVQDNKGASTPSQVGRQVDVAATLQALGQIVTRLESGEVIVVVSETPPQVASTEDAARTITTILASDLEIVVEDPGPTDPGPWIASRESLAGMLLIEKVVSADGLSASYSVRLDEAQLSAFLEPLTADLARDPVNARFIFDDESSQLMVLTPSVRGRALNIPSSIQQINQMAASENHRIPLVFDYADPAVPDTATAADLGITQLVSSATTYFAGSSDAREKNIQTAASRFHGILVAPGEEFSFNHYLGDVSPATGYDEAWVILSGRTIKGVGGGVCQVSTTAFQAAFYAGFPITQRVEHAYRVGYYERGEGVGMDATVFSPVVDLRFINDTSSWLLIETYVDLDKNTLTFKFYSTSDGRTVTKDGPYVTNVVPHGPPVYEENPDVPPGESRQVDFAVDGADVKVVRTVWRNGEILYQDTFRSHYLPWQAVYQVAPGHLPSGTPAPTPTPD